MVVRQCRGPGRNGSLLLRFLFPASHDPSHNQYHEYRHAKTEQ
jgi:hypothetical protein